MCSECTRVTLKRCENQNFPGGTCICPQILAGTAHHWHIATQLPILSPPAPKHLLRHWTSLKLREIENVSR